MMNSCTLANFVIQKSPDKAYVFQFLPGTNWDEIQSALDEFKTEFAQLKIQIEEQEKAKQDTEQKTDPV